MLGRDGGQPDIGLEPGTGDLSHAVDHHGDFGAKLLAQRCGKVPDGHSKRAWGADFSRIVSGQWWRFHHKALLDVDNGPDGGRKRWRAGQCQPAHLQIAARGDLDLSIAVMGGLFGNGV